MRNGTPRIRATERTLAMLEAVIADGGRHSIAALARSIDMPVSTAHRQVATLVAEGYLAPARDGRHIAGPRLLGMLHRLDEKQIVANVAAPLLDQLASEVRAVVQFGTFENDMVTYRIKTGEGAAGLFTKVGMQLEAYCSGIGKVLLAHLPPAERNAYLAGGPFVPLTAKTIVDPAGLAAELDRIRRQGFAIDDGEIADDLVCIAVPISNSDGRVVAALSVSTLDQGERSADREALVPMLTNVARRIETAAFGGYPR